MCKDDNGSGRERIMHYPYPNYLNGCLVGRPVTRQVSIKNYLQVFFIPTSTTKHIQIFIYIYPRVEYHNIHTRPIKKSIIKYSYLL